MTMCLVAFDKIAQFLYGLVCFLSFGKLKTGIVEILMDMLVQDIRYEIQILLMPIMSSEDDRRTKYS
jgi:hypothetical protein